MILNLLSRFINNVPYVIDKLSPLRGELRSKGYLQLDSCGETKKILTLAKGQLDEASRKVVDSNDGVNLVQKLDVQYEVLSAYVASLDKKNGNFISKYLGTYKVDIAYTFVDYFSNEVHRNSQLWHHDSVGHRLKIFISPDEVSHAPTEIVEGTHLTSHYGDYFWDKDKRTSYKPEDEVVKVATTVDVVNVIDTNSIHRGVATTGEGLRRLVVIELSHPLKSFCKGRVGRRNKP